MNQDRLESALNSEPPVLVAALPGYVKRMLCPKCQKNKPILGAKWIGNPRMYRICFDCKK